MKVLIACEESQRVCSAFRSKGHDAFSCDIQECSGGHPEWHIKGDCLPLLNGNCKFETQNGERHSLEGKWDLIIAHPPCTYLTVTANRWFDTGKYGESAWERMTERNKAIAFFYRFVMADCEKIAIENPMGVISTAYRKADQIIQPYMFGDPFEKRTCLWLKGLPKLEETNRVDPPPTKAVQIIKFNAGMVHKTCKPSEGRTKQGTQQNFSWNRICHGGTVGRKNQKGW